MLEQQSQKGLGPLIPLPVREALGRDFDEEALKYNPGYSRNSAAARPQKSPRGY